MITNAIKIEQIRLDFADATACELIMTEWDNSNALQLTPPAAVKAKLWKLDSVRVAGWVPSKVMVIDQQVACLFYIHDSLMRLKLSNTHMWLALIEDIQPNITVGYPTDLPLLIDQVVADGKVNYFVIFGDDVKDSVVIG